MKRLFFSSLNGLGTFVENQLSAVYDFVSELSILINVKWFFFLLTYISWLVLILGNFFLLLIIVSCFVNNTHFSFPLFFVGDVGMEYGDKDL